MSGVPRLSAATTREAVASATEALEHAGCDTPRLDAEVLIADALGVDRAALVARPDEPLAPDAVRRLAGHLGRRARREPIAYVVGRRGFRRIELEVDGRALVPRPETETLVEAALDLPQGARVHDVGTGSGAVALALKDERPDLRVSASDASPAAVDVARSNAQRLRLDVEMSVATGLPPGEYDLVVANLPYVREDEWPALAPEIVEWEPRDALLGGADGLDAIRALVAGAPAGTRLALEHAPDQAAAVRELLADARTIDDLAGRPRVTVGVAQ